MNGYQSSAKPFSERELDLQLSATFTRFFWAWPRAGQNKTANTYVIEINI